jgi:hypothetical protein
MEQGLVKNTVVRFGSTLRPLLANAGKASTCHTERRKSRRDVREVAFIAVLANEGKGAGSSPVTEMAFVVFTLLCSLFLRSFTVFC